MRKLALLMMLFLAGCAGRADSLEDIAKREAARLAEPTTALSAFASYELRPMRLSPEVEEDSRKVKHAAVLEEKIKEELEPLLAEWASSNESGRSGTLIVQPELVELRIVSGGARFFLRRFSGRSHIVLDLRLIDGKSDNEIGKPRITTVATKYAGRIRTGIRDRKLRDYLALIVYHYMAKNY